jgi:hypothetical protein
LWRSRLDAARRGDDRPVGDPAGAPTQEHGHAQSDQGSGQRTPGRQSLQHRWPVGWTIFGDH